MGARRGAVPAILAVSLTLVLAASSGIRAQTATSTDAPAPAATPAPPVPLAPLAAPPTAAPTTTPSVADTQAELKKLEASMGVSQERADALRKQIADMDGDRAKQNAALIAAGQKVKLAEIEVDSMEERLTALASAEQQVRARLDGTNASVSNMLAALERISLNPPPALIVDPSDALGSARSAILISAIVPQLRAKADSVVADLKHLQDIKAEAEKEQEQLKANFSVLEEEQLRIATLIQARKQGIADANAKLDAEQKQAEAMAAKATSLKQLVAQLTTQVAAVGAAASAANASAPQLPSTTPEAIKVALANTSRTSPAIPFDSARGYLVLPAVGADVQDFGTNDGLGGIAHGVSYATRPGAQVVAPADGWVMYKGPYLNYGQIVILNPGQNYTILLAGLNAVSVDIGQFVLEGEPLGSMGSRTIGHTVSGDASVSQPTLYIELRKNDQPIDPTGWWAPPANATQSG